VPAPLSDEALVARAKTLHELVVVSKLRQRGIALTEKALGQWFGFSTVSVVQTRVRGRVIRIINTNHPELYRVLQQEGYRLLLPGEVLGSEPIRFSGRTLDKKRLTDTIHAEQLGVHDARRFGGTAGEIASSNKGCKGACVALLQEYFPAYRHVNPANTSPQVSHRINLLKPDGTRAPRGSGPGAATSGRAPSSARNLPREGIVGSAWEVGEGAAERLVSAANRGTVERGSVAIQSSRSVAPDVLSVPRVSSGRFAATPKALARAVGVPTRVVVRSIATLTRSLLRAALAVVATIGLDIAFIVFDILIMLEERKRDKALQKAIETAARTQLPPHARAVVQSRGPDIADFYLARWGKAADLFLYFAPVMDITSQPGNSQEKYRFKTEFRSDGRVVDLVVSRTLLEPKFEEIKGNWDGYYAKFRWSIPFPMFTPFDAYSAYLDVVAEVFVARWLYAARAGPLKPAATRGLTDMARRISTIAALLKFEVYAGFSATEPYDAGRAAAERLGIVRRIWEIIDNQAIPLADTLERGGTIDPDAEYVMLETETSEVQGRLRRLLTPGMYLSDYLGLLGYDLQGLPESALGYRRRESVRLDQLLSDFGAYEQQYYRQLVAPVIEYLPKNERMPALDLQLTAPVGELFLETVAPFEEASGTEAAAETE
jgi:hypothetical protein